jgi:xanthosine utilization system XapX-like protein
MDWYTFVAGLQVGIVAILLLLGVFVGYKTADMSDKVMWELARTVVIFLPLALAWFGLFSAMFLENINLVIPVLVGVSAVCANFIIDSQLLQRLLG